jgi:hypothetical protein
MAATMPLEPPTLAEIPAHTPTAGVNAGAMTAGNPQDFGPGVQALQSQVRIGLDAGLASRQAREWDRERVDGRVSRPPNPAGRAEAMLREDRPGAPP